MKTLLYIQKYGLELLLVMSGLGFWYWSIGGHFVSHDIPLGYDPGLYKVMFEEMGALSYRDWGNLSGRVQKMYPPFLGMLGALLMQFGVTSQGLVTRGAVGLSGLMILSISAVAKRLLGTLGASGVFFFACSSFVLYQLFWRGYLKQMMGVFIIMSVILVLLMKPSLIQYLLVGLLLGVGGLTQRPALVLGGLVGAVWVLVGVKNDRKVLRGAVVALVVLSTVGFHFREIQIAPMIQPFLDAIDVPVYQDGYKAGGTFLTMSQWIQTDRVVMILSIVGGGVVIRDTKRRREAKRLLIVTGILIVRVLGQGSFYQRMIGYLGPMMLVLSGYAIVYTRTKYKRYLLGGLLVAHAGVSGVWIQRTRPPLITPVEYTMIQQIPELVPEDAIIMVSGIWYSPRVRGRSGREVIAPGLFDYNQRGNQGQGRSTQRIDVDGDTKCETVAKTFGYLDRPLYAWVGITQDPELMDGSCITKVLDHPDYVSALYRIAYDD